MKYAKVKCCKKCPYEDHGDCTHADNYGVDVSEAIKDVADGIDADSVHGTCPIEGEAGLFIVFG